MWEVSEALEELLEPMPENITVVVLNRSSGGCGEKADHLASVSAPLVTYHWLSHSWIYGNPLAIPLQPCEMFPTHSIHPRRNTLKINWVVIISHYLPAVLKGI